MMIENNLNTLNLIKKLEELLSSPKNLYTERGNSLLEKINTILRKNLFNVDSIFNNSFENKIQLSIRTIYEGESFGWDREYDERDDTFEPVFFNVDLYIDEDKSIVSLATFEDRILKYFDKDENEYFNIATVSYNNYIPESSISLNDGIYKTKNLYDLYDMKDQIVKDRFEKYKIANNSPKLFDYVSKQIEEAFEKPILFGYTDTPVQGSIKYSCLSLN